jgi:hypothetical protein
VSRRIRRAKRRPKGLQSGCIVLAQLLTLSITVSLSPLAWRPCGGRPLQQVARYRRWSKLPEGIPRILDRLRFLDAPINTLRTFLAAANSFGAAGSQRSSPGPFDGGAILSSVFAGTRSFASGLFTTVMFLYFLLVSGDSFLRRLVEVLPRFASKRQAVDISQQIGRDISAYLLTITLMNALVGAATALVMWSTGVGDPVLWGTVAFILNYVPILGPGAAIFIFLFAGSLTITSTWQALLPAALYGAIHVIEGETVTPMLLARRFTPIGFSWSFPSCSGFGFGASRARSFRRRFWPQPRSSVIAFVL